MSLQLVSIYLEAIVGSHFIHQYEIKQQPLSTELLLWLHLRQNNSCAWLGTVTPRGCG